MNSLNLLIALLYADPANPRRSPVSHEGTWVLCGSHRQRWVYI